MTIILVQHHRALGMFETTSRRTIAASDTTRADALMATTAAAESGYFDVLLLRGRYTAAQFSKWAMTVPAAMYQSAVDHVISIK